ncbi:alpha/beta hydrolase fold domain-containing protein [Gordonia sp. TBRC 11910]|uniref:Alpha/beta hydrolase fold domain-containing protein n=1 Tax=Gordonia asplenii TaxID=2725283 RepID=A0A848KX72_9ACTN|nr:PHB depolymerase family esterase [Gordonia asplenii]NMO02842.1 alpha/beta hydrolase fold domain-containing protein [Gordonia asplenii]
MASPFEGSLVTKTYRNDAGVRDYQVYTPDRAVRGRPMIVWLHGASNVVNGDSRTLNRSNSLVRLAKTFGYSVVAPDESLAASPSGAWNIGDPTTMVRGRGEASIIAGIIRQETKALGADPRRVYVAGHSAGGGMANYVAALYPELIAATAPSAGFPYLMDPTGLAVDTAMGPRRHPMPTFITQGSDDTLAVPALGEITKAAALHGNGLRPSDVVERKTLAAHSDRYVVSLTEYGRGARTSVVYAYVRGAGHPSGPGGLTLAGPALDRRVVEFLLAQSL